MSGKRAAVLDRETGRFAEVIRCGRVHVVRYEDGSRLFYDAHEPLPDRFEPQT